ncbi:toxin [Micromonospora arborensis]|uniref:Toxin n=1 Tax=Micromonospora arborensis TaxID=2116518 RepID=A0A318NCA8_9ACTN|nr:toxin [Micromonospora arborensis]PYC65368.1 toxin [Micromonospora arborensis]
MTNYFHEALADTVLYNLGGEWIDKQDTAFSYSFENFFHPFVGELIEQLNRRSLAGMLDPDFHQGLSDPTFFDSLYTALANDLVKISHEPKEIDLGAGGPYSGYNWELLFHVPLTIAVHLSKNQRFAEARKWFHYIFDPTSNDTSLPVPQRFWKFLAFRKAGVVKQVDEQLMILSKPLAECTPAELDMKQKILQGYEAIKNRPFQPHAVARTRQLAYQYCVVMKYLDNLIAWGDSLFRQDTSESLNEATQLYVLAATLLGQRPQRIPRTGTVRPKTYAELRKQGLDAMGNTLVEMEGKFPLSAGMPKMGEDDPDAAGPLFGIGRTLYFCIPRNEKLLGYWDTVADRLFKIRNGMNIEGIARQLALFDPPLDPGMLVKAAAAGIDIGAIISGTNQPISPVRAPFLIQMALELSGEVRGLGSALVVAIEKGDGERLAVLRQGHETRIQQMQQEVRFLQWASAQEATRSLLTNRRPALERLHYYQRLLGLPADPNTADELAVSFEGLALTEETFAEAYGKLVAQYDKSVAAQDLPKLRLAEESSPTILSGARGSGKLYLSANEDVELNTHLPTARDTSLHASVANAMASAFAPVPDADADAHFWGIGGKIKLNVGTALVAAAKIAGDISGIVAAWERDQAGMAARTASYERRADEWLLQYNLAAHDLASIGRQILTSILAEQVTRHDYLITKQQVADTQEADRFLRSKFSNEELYAWTQGEVSRLYYEYYRFAIDTARKAEQAMKRELMRPEVDAQDFVKFNYWDGGRRGLLSGEALQLDVKRMQLAYHENNKREYELTRHVSLRRLAPVALLALKTTGSCRVTVPEWVFDLDTPGHYLRRIRSVGLTIPCVTGPYTSLSCTLTLTRSSVRTAPLAGDGYRRQGGEDGRFVDYFSATQSIVTSSGQNDSGLFETSLRDERVLPFEGAGVESEWTLSLPDEFRQVDYATISDAILHFRYTAREGGVPLRTAAVENLKELVADADETGLSLLLSLRHDFPSEWSAFVDGNADFSATLRADYLPYLAQRRTVTIAGFELYGLTAGRDPKHHLVGDQAMWDAASAALNTPDGFTFTAAPDAAGPTQVLSRSADADVWLIMRYTLE